ncbi:MAG: hypothetical protein H0U27_05560 [Nitrosopumilus sp.]|nr:hypothetical protein [Nitrosopumilus sp.]
MKLIIILIACLVALTHAASEIKPLVNSNTLAYPESYETLDDFMKFHSNKRNIEPEDCYNSLTPTQWKQIVKCAKAYWSNQVGDRSVDPWAANCFDNNMVAAPLRVDTSFGKAAVIAGWSQVSTSDPNGNPYFEDNPASVFDRIGVGCYTTGEPFVEVNVNRTLRNTFTNVTSIIPYYSTFTFRHNSDNHTTPANGVPDYTIIHLDYIPNLLKEHALWPSLPLTEDPVAQHYVCAYLTTACDGLVDWSPYPNCWQWMANHDLTGSPPYYDNSVPNVPLTQSCVYFLAYLNSSPNPRTTYCYALPLCTGNFGVRSLRQDSPQDMREQYFNMLVQDKLTFDVNEYLSI